MEVLPSSGVQSVGDCESAQQNPGSSSIHGKSNAFNHENQFQISDDGEVAQLSPDTENNKLDNMIGSEGLMDGVPSSEGRVSGASSSDCLVESQTLLYDAHESKDYEPSLQNSVASRNSHLIVDMIEFEPSNCKDGDSSFSEPKWLQHDESTAVWVKWRGLWQAGIKCARADWPLSTLKAKPTHDRKKYLVIFFPRTRNYSWADTLLIRSIYEFPQPIAYKSHKLGLRMVRDLTVARRYIMQKLAISMLNIVDQFHTEALVDSARDVMTWKQFAMEASHCSGYSSLGKMLLKLQKMMLQQYINVEWLQHSYHSWAERCQVAENAESVELLTEELFDSILWNKVNDLWITPVQPTLGSEWKTWKHEVVKWFSASHPISNGGETQKRSYDSGPSNINPQVSRKRPKLEVRRAEAHTIQSEASRLHQNMAIEIDCGFSNHQDSTKPGTLASEPFKMADRRDEPDPIESTGNITNRWDEIVVEAGISEPTHAKNIQTPGNEEKTIKTTIEPVNKNKQCIAFIESKGRQCVRWANDGDVYCCVHLASRFLGSPSGTEKRTPVQSPLCEGTTVLGTRCKHRSLPGSSFCKKHRLRTESSEILDSSVNTVKRKLEDTIPNAQVSACKDIVLIEKVDSAIQVEPASIMDGGAIHGRNSSIENTESSIQVNISSVMLHCLGSSPFDNTVPCYESPKRYSLYCDLHLPSWLKRARNGKSRIVPKELFIDLLRGCSSRQKKLQLHQACELFYKLFKSILSLRNPVPMEVQLQWALSEASKDHSVGQFLLTLVRKEKERLQDVWGISANEDLQLPSRVIEETEVMPLAIESVFDDAKSINCKFCSKEFVDDQELSNHCMENHKKEAQWYFRGYACAICLDSFTNMKLLETHVQERHHVQFVEQFMLLQCIPCKSSFGNTEQLWLHVLSVHPGEFKLAMAAANQHNQSPADEEGYQQRVEPIEAVSKPTETVSKESINDNLGSKSIRKFVCRFCGLKFDLLPDLGRHHQAAHMGTNNPPTSHPPKEGIRYYAYKLKSGRLGRPRFKKSQGAASYRIKNRVGANIEKHTQLSRLVSTQLHVQSQENSAGTLGKLEVSQHAAVANILYSKIQKTKPQPSNHDILAIARTACCKVSLKASLEGKYGILSERVYLKAAKLCSEHNVLVDWHKEGFICHRGCQSFKDPGFLPPLVHLKNGFSSNAFIHSSDRADDEWEVDECHYVIDKHDLNDGSKRKFSILCDDISFGKESIPVSCVVEEDVLPDDTDGQTTEFCLPWKNFTYVTRPVLDQSHRPAIESLQLGCACRHSVCGPGTCDHVYLFDSDYEDAKDIYSKSMHGRFPYDDKRRIVLEEGYLVYECNSLCCCDKTCPNRVLQNGVSVKLELFRTRNKGWAMRAAEPILRGSFVCEYIGEVIDEQEAENRRIRYGEEGWGYMYKINAHSNDMSRLIEGEVPYVIDATKYGNISRFINHSCLPNLVNRQVLVDSMDSQRAHIGLYASRDISSGEELTYNYRYELLPGKEYPCLCGASQCRHRLF